MFAIERDDAHYPVTQEKKKVTHKHNQKNTQDYWGKNKITEGKN